MRVLYIAQYGEGSTSRMRGERLKEILFPATFEVIDLNVPLLRHSRLIRSLGWHFNTGPLIGDVNRYIRENMQGSYDLVWVDKGNFIDARLVKEMPTALRVHYTPDTAIRYNQSRSFFKAIPLYDYCITTKSFELEDYRQKGARNLLFCTQGYDRHIHRPYTLFEEKEGVVFIGLNEPGKEMIVAKLLEEKIKVTLAGVLWDKFAYRHKNNALLTYLGAGVYGEDYGRLLSKSQLGLGLLSKRFPERHTTRTIEIPACGTALVSERNEDTSKIFTEEDALLFGDMDELMEKIRRALRSVEYRKQITDNGFRKITGNAFDYPSILKDLLQKMDLIK